MGTAQESLEVSVTKLNGLIRALEIIAAGRKDVLKNGSASWGDVSETEHLVKLLDEALEFANGMGM